MELNLSVREMQAADIDRLVQYWLGSDSASLMRMGVDLNKLPTPHQLREVLTVQLALPVEEKRSYCIIWQLDGRPIGHCNTNPTVFGQDAYMHLHLWDATVRQKGMGTALVEMTLPWFFNNLQLKKLYCEPYALNPAPNKTLQKTGFKLVKEYATTPGTLNFEQPVKRWELSHENFKRRQQA